MSHNSHHDHRSHLARGMAFILAVGAAPSMAGAQSARPPVGLTNVTGWNGVPVDYSNGGIGTTAGIDINGQVGYRLVVPAPTSGCAGSDFGYGGPVRGGATLPPGLGWDALGNDTISGIPTERGHWIVQIERLEIVCNGITYNGFRQELRFHITGSGRVVQ